MTDWRNRIVGHDNVDPKTLEANPRNYRRHPAGQRNAIRGSLDELGWIDSVIVNRTTGLILDGHLRVEESARNGNSTIPVTYIELTPEEEALALATFDPITAMAEADAKVLESLLADIETDNVALQELMDGMAEDAGIVAELGDGRDVEPRIDRAEELREKWGVNSGDLWILDSGKGHPHRLICGDCVDPAVVERVMGGEKAAAVVTDPPYGVEYADKNRFLNSISLGNRIQKPIENDHGGKANIQATWKSAFSEMERVMDPGAVVYCFMPQGGDQMMMMMMMTGAGIEPRHELIWLKNNHVLGRTDYAYKHEPILYAWKDGGHKFYGDFQTSVIECNRSQKSDLHPTTKPVELIERLVSNSSRVGEVVYDPFVGSGTTLIACEQLGRQCRAAEIDPGYTAVSLERWHEATGKMPKLVDEETPTIAGVPDGGGA